MKKFVKIMASCFALTLCVLFGANTADAANLVDNANFATKADEDGTETPTYFLTIDSLRQTNATATTVTFQWDAPAGSRPGVTTYILYNYVSNGSHTAARYANGTPVYTTANQITVNRSVITSGQVFVLCSLYSSTDPSVCRPSADRIIVKSIPTVAPSNPRLGSSYGSAVYGWNTVTGADGYEVYVYKNNKKVATISNITSSWPSLRKYTGNFCSFRARAYIRLDNGKKLYGPMSNYSAPYCYISGMKAKVQKGMKVKLSWKKVNGISGYTLYGSTSKTKGYKKIASISKKKTSYTVSKVKGKKLKRYKNYYFRLIPKGKIGSSTKTAKYYYPNPYGFYIYTTYR